MESKAATKRISPQYLQEIKALTIKDKNLTFDQAFKLHEFFDSKWKVEPPELQKEIYSMKINIANTHESISFVKKIDPFQTEQLTSYRDEDPDLMARIDSYHYCVNRTPDERFMYEQRKELLRKQESELTFREKGILIDWFLELAKYTHLSYAKHILGKFRFISEYIEEMQDFLNIQSLLKQESLTPEDEAKLRNWLVKENEEIQDSDYFWEHCKRNLLIPKDYLELIISRIQDPDYYGFKKFLKNTGQNTNDDKFMYGYLDTLERKSDQQHFTSLKKGVLNNVTCLVGIKPFQGYIDDFISKNPRRGRLVAQFLKGGTLNTKPTYTQYEIDALEACYKDIRHKNATVARTVFSPFKHVLSDFIDEVDYLDRKGTRTTNTQIPNTQKFTSASATTGISPNTKPNPKMKPAVQLSEKQYSEIISKFKYSDMINKFKEYYPNDDISDSIQAALGAYRNQDMFPPQLSEKERLAFIIDTFIGGDEEYCDEELNLFNNIITDMLDMIDQSKICIKRCRLKMQTDANADDIINVKNEYKTKISKTHDEIKTKLKALDDVRMSTKGKQLSTRVKSRIHNLFKHLDDKMLSLIEKAKMLKIPEREMTSLFDKKYPGCDNSQNPLKALLYRACEWKELSIKPSLAFYHLTDILNDGDNDSRDRKKVSEYKENNNNNAIGILNLMINTLDTCEQFRQSSDEQERKVLKLNAIKIFDNIYTLSSTFLSENQINKLFEYVDNLFLPYIDIITSPQMQSNPPPKSTQNPYTPPYASTAQVPGNPPGGHTAALRNTGQPGNQHQH